MDTGEKLSIILILGVIAYSLFNYFHSQTEKKLNPQNISSKEVKNRKETLYKYILDVINNGSSGHSFKGGEMEGGYISKDDAKIVACYVLELSGRKCPHSYPKDIADGYFSSVCAGCHGNDAKGIDGIYPDLTKKNYVGF